MAAAVGSGLAAGVFFAFSTFVMPALGRLPAERGVAAMQAVNVAAINPWFMTVLFGTGALSTATIVGALASWDAAYGLYLLAGGALYLLGVLGVTIAFHVPRNDALARLDPTEAASHWSRYLREWTAWNHVRTIAPLLAAALQTGALRVG